MVNIIWNTPEEEILSIGDIKPYEYEDFGEIMGLMPCEQCGEMVSFAGFSVGCSVCLST